MTNRVLDLGYVKDLTLDEYDPRDSWELVSATNSKIVKADKTFLNLNCRVGFRKTRIKKTTNKTESRINSLFGMKNDIKKPNEKVKNT